MRRRKAFQDKWEKETLDISNQIFSHVKDLSKIDAQAVEAN